ncbi:N-acyl homoserine lactonase family protein [Bacillus cereus]|nr:N-acyl homoserine lactonase family protein [Bacillus cereus]
MTLNNFKLHVLDNGELLVNKNIFITNNTVDSMKKSEEEFMKIPIYTVLIDHPDGKILFDTACHPKRAVDLLQGTFPYSAYSMKESDYLINRLESLGVRPEDIKYVVISHLHFDHSGCLEMFPNAQIIVQEDELQHTLKRFHEKNFPAGYIEEDISNWIRANLQWKEIKRSEKSVILVEGVDILNFGSGHTFGMLGMRINLPKTGKIILTSDAVYSKIHYAQPIQIPSEDAVYDLPGYLRTIEEIRNYEKIDLAQVWFGHDKLQFQSLIKSTEGYYE